MGHLYLIYFCWNSLIAGDMPPRSTPKRNLVKYPKGKTKEIGEGSKNKLGEIKYPTKEYVPVIQFLVYEESLP
jgi:hypothetical protein